MNGISASQKAHDWYGRHVRTRPYSRSGHKTALEEACRVIPDPHHNGMVTLFMQYHTLPLGLDETVAREIEAKIDMFEDCGMYSSAMNYKWVYNNLKEMKERLMWVGY